LDALIEIISKIVEPFGRGKDVDLKILPPFIVYLVYKAASIVSERIRMGDESKNNLRRFKSLRNVLQLISQRWLVAGIQSN
jgi:hypothetical protein